MLFSLLPSDLVAKLLAIRSQLIGPEDECTRTKAQQCGSEDEYQGGVWWERSSSSESVGRDTRAYNLAQSYECVRKLIAPGRLSKVYEESLTEHGKLRKELVEASNHVQY